MGASGLLSGFGSVVHRGCDSGDERYVLARWRVLLVEIAVSRTPNLTTDELDRREITIEEDNTFDIDNVVPITL